MMVRPAVVALVLLTAVACTDDGDPTAEPSETTPASSARTTTSPTSTPPTQTTQAPTTTKPTPKPTPTKPVETHDGTCPYLATDFVELTIGQRLARTTVTTAEPPGCAFYRPDAEVAASVTPTRAASLRDARLKVLAAVGDSGNPLPDLGDGGVVKVVEDGAVLAVSRGTLVVVVRINQQSSLQATEVGRKVLEML